MDSNLKLEEVNLIEKYGAETVLPPDEFLAKMNFLKERSYRRIC